MNDGIGAPLLLRRFSVRAHWQIESALEFHPLYCKEDLVLFTTSYDPVYLFSLHRLERDVIKEEGYRGERGGEGERWMWW
jgi:hypothetical protein